MDTYVTLPWWQIVLTCVVPLVSVALSYIFGRLHASGSHRRDARRERYDKLYAPYVNYLYIGMMWEREFASLPPSNRHVFFELIMSNAQYLDLKTAALFPEFYNTYQMLFTIDGTALTNDELQAKRVNAEKVNDAFVQVTVSLLRQALRISRKLHMPKLAEYALAMYTQ